MPAPKPQSLFALTTLLACGAASADSVTSAEVLEIGVSLDQTTDFAFDTPNVETPSGQLTSGDATLNSIQLNLADLIYPAPVDVIPAGADFL